MHRDDEEKQSSMQLVVHCPWCNKEEPSVTIGIAHYRWRIHKCLIVRRSSYFERVLCEQQEHFLPQEFPGGAAALDAVVSFCFDSRVPVLRPWNVAALRCAAEFLGMDDRGSAVNLSHKADSYLTRIVLRSWPHTLLVLFDCYKSFLPLAEEVGIVSRCLEALAMFISTSFGSRSTSSSCDDGETIWWIEDIVRMPTAFFARMIRRLRSKGVCERLIGEVLIKWTEIWFFNNDGNDQKLSNGLMLAKSCCSSLSSLETSSVEEGGDERCLDLELQRIVSQEGEGRSPAWSRGSSSVEDCRLNVSPNLQVSTDVVNFQEASDCFQVGFSTAAEKLELLEEIVGLLPYERTALPISFLFLLLRYAFAMDASQECKSQIETRISLQLENATLDDFLMPFKSPSREDFKRNSELDSMKQIVARFLTQHHRNILSASSDHQQLQCKNFAGHNNNISNSNTQISSSNPCFTQQHLAVCSVARIWDEYLTEIACDGSISPQKFTELVEVVPAYARSNHDQLYKSIHIFLKAHTDTSPQERTTVCRALNCLKLSQEACIQAVQNELMPLRTIVQAMFMQQLQTRNAINSHFLRGNNIAVLQNSPVFQHKQELQHLKLNTVDKSTDMITDGLKETNTRLQSLEAAMAQMRKSLRENTTTTTRLSDLFVGNDGKELKNSRDDNSSTSCVSCSSSSGSSSQNNNQGKNSETLKQRKRKFFLRKFGRSSSRKGVAKVAKLFQKMGFWSGFCKTTSGNRDSSSSLKELPNGCLPIDTNEAGKNRIRKKSWDEAEFRARQQRKHLRHHSVA